MEMYSRGCGLMRGSTGGNSQLGVEALEGHFAKHYGSVENVPQSSSRNQNYVNVDNHRVERIGNLIWDCKHLILAWAYKSVCQLLSFSMLYLRLRTALGFLLLFGMYAHFPQFDLR